MPFHDLTTEDILTETFEEGEPISTFFSSSTEIKRRVSKEVTRRRRIYTFVKFWAQGKR